MEDDPFCKESVLEGAFYTTKHMMAVYDIAPVVKGHSLIIPKRHVSDIRMLSSEEMLDMLETMKRVSVVIFRLYGDGSDSYDLTAQIGRYSGMSIKHLHMHFIPRRGDDQYQDSVSIYAAIEKVKRLERAEYLSEVRRLREEVERVYGSEKESEEG